MARFVYKVAVTVPTARAAGQPFSDPACRAGTTWKVREDEVRDTAALSADVQRAAVLRKFIEQLYSRTRRERLKSAV